MTTEFEEDDRICGDTVRLTSSSARGLNNFIINNVAFFLRNFQFQIDHLTKKRGSPLPTELLQRVRQARFCVNKLHFNRSQVLPVLFKETLELIAHVEVVLAFLKSKDLSRV